MKRTVLALMMLVGCGDALDERQGAVETPVSDSLTAGRAETGAGRTFKQAIGDFTLNSISGLIGDGRARRVSLGGGAPWECKMRAGVLSEVVAGGQTHKVFFVYDSNPQNGSIVPGATISPGQSFRARVRTQNGGATAELWFVNLSTGQSWTMTKTKPAGCTWVGDTAGWIEDRPIINGTQRALADFGTESVSAAWALDTTGQQWGLGVLPTTVITMQQGASTLATPGPYNGTPTVSQWSVTWNARL